MILPARPTRGLLLTFALPLLLGCVGEDVPKPAFLDVTATHLPQAPELHALDASLADVDGDRDLDAVLAVEGGANRLYPNNGHGRFTWREDAFGTRPHDTEQVRAADFNRDGQPDILFLNLTSNAGEWEKTPQARLLIQDAKGRFVDETAARLPANRFSSWGGAVVDFDGDGHPDLVLGAIEVPGFRPMQLRAYVNDGQGRFRDLTATAMPREAVGRGWSMAAGDVNGDGADDMIVGGWGTQARLLLGQPR